MVVRAGHFCRLQVSPRCGAEDTRTRLSAVLAGPRFAEARNVTVRSAQFLDCPFEVLHMRMRVPSRRTADRGPLAALALSMVMVVTGAVSQASAQTPFVPYFGKNNIHYDKFDWHIYTTDHFEIYYYPDIEKHLERVAGYAEGAYQQVSADLKHDLSFKIPLILFKTDRKSVV